MAKIDILISSGGNVESQSPSPSPSPDKKPKIGVKPAKEDSPSIKASVAASMLAKAGINALKTSFDFAKSNYGNFTGDYIGQQKIDTVYGVASSLIGFGSTIAAGAVAGGPIGASVAAVIASVNIGVSAAQSTINYNQSILKTNFSSSFNAQRIGTILHGGNR